MLRVANTLAVPGQLAKSLATSSRVQLHTSSVRSAVAAQADRKPRSTTGRNSPSEKAKKGRDKPARPRKEGLAPRKDDGSPLYPLRANDLARRLKQICDEGHFDEAVSVLKSAPVGAQNTPVWNTVIWECLKSGKYKLAFKLFTDMKRRGFLPSIRTYSSMLSGYARITGPKWSTLAVQLENVQTIYSQFVTLIEQLKRSGKIDSEVCEHISTARAGYITVLGENGQHQRMFDAYNAMETQGSLAPDRVVFTAMFKALMARKTLASAVKPEEHDYESGMLPQAGSARSQNAADARLLWRQMLKIFETNAEVKLGERYSIDTFLLREFIGVLALGRPSDQNFALDIVREHLHLSIPSETGGNTSKPLASRPPLLTTHTLDATLDLANEMNRYRLTVQLFQQVVDLEDAMDRAASRRHGADVHTQPSILDRGLADRVLFAYSCMPGEADQALELVRWMLRRVALGEHRMRPEASSFEHVLIASWRSQNWVAATAAWELMTGYRMKSFADGRPPTAAAQERANRGKLALEPGPQHASALARTALAKRNPEDARVCLRMLEAVNVKDMLPSSSFGNAGADSDVSGSKSVRRHLFYGHKLAEAMVPLINDAVGDTPPAVRSEEQKRWLTLLALAKKGRNGSDQAKSATGRDDSIPGTRREGRRSSRPLKPRGSYDSQ